MEVYIIFRVETHGDVHYLHCARPIFKDARGGYTKFVREDGRAETQFGARSNRIHTLLVYLIVWETRIVWFSCPPMSSRRYSTWLHLVRALRPRPHPYNPYNPFLVQRFKGVLCWN